MHSHPSLRQSCLAQLPRLLCVILKDTMSRTRFARFALALIFAFHAASRASTQISPNETASIPFAPGLAADYNITLVTDSAPDLTDIDSYLRSITSQYAAPQEKAIAIWRWSQRLRKQTTNPMEDGQYVLDPIHPLFSTFGKRRAAHLSPGAQQPGSRCQPVFPRQRRLALCPRLA